SDRRLEVRVEDWSLLGGDRLKLRAEADGNALDLHVRSLKPPAIHGIGGVSRKGACASCASHYYSLTRLQTTGNLRYAGVRYAVQGISWMDHEFGSSELQPDQVGWDWFSLQLDDGREVMLYRLRRRDGTTVPQSSGTVIDASGRTHYVPVSGFNVDALGRWTSPHTGGQYPSGWHVTVPSFGIDVIVTPTLRDQELADAQIGVAYWEGSCVVASAARAQAATGVAYVELTGYAGPLGL
ncbi:MAG: carotenoid 1,2-hydratase, partial [Candidatus Eremiobacteraeota bacterium]|nr:carotenoid 1,2-hydratase [Candidatus Eremiobacteraeota bacterium]